MNCVAGLQNFLEFSQAPPGVLYRLNFWDEISAALLGCE